MTAQRFSLTPVLKKIEIFNIGFKLNIGIVLEPENNEDFKSVLTFSVSAAVFSVRSIKVCK